MNPKLRKRIASALALGCLFLSVNTVTLANDDPSPCPYCLQSGRPSPEDMRQHLRDSLDKLVSDSTITSQQADDLLAFFKEKDAQRRAELEKLKNMSEQERQAFFAQRKQPPDFLKDIRQAAHLSKEQAKAVAAIMRPPQGPHPEGPLPPMDDK